MGRSIILWRFYTLYKDTIKKMCWGSAWSLAAGYVENQRLVEEIFLNGLSNLIG